MFWKIFVVLVSVWAFLFEYSKRNFWKLYKIFKNESSYVPLIGHGYQFVGNNEDRMSMIKEYGRKAVKSGGITSLFLGPRFFIVVADPVMFEFISKNTLEKDEIMSFLRVLTGNGNIFAPVSIWKPRRKILAPTFSIKNLNQFVTVFSRQSSILVEKLQQYASGDPFPIWNHMTRYTMDSVCETTLGVQMNAQSEADQPFLRAFEDFARLCGARLAQPWLHNDVIYKLLGYYAQVKKPRDYLCNFVNKLIKEKRKAMEECTNDDSITDNNGNKGSKIKTFLELLIESSGGSQGYTDLELQEETLVMILAGTDTSAVGTSFTCLMLAQHPDIQEQAYQEIKQVCGDTKRLVTADDLPRLKYLDSVIRETLRLYPPVPVTTRVVEKDVTLPTGVKLVKGTGIVNHIWGTHHNPQYWGDDVEEFRPERFLEPLKHPAAYIPFSHGPRNCLGAQYAMMSMKTALASILRKYRILPRTSLKTNSHEKIRLTFEVMMKDVDNFTVILKNRE